MALILSVICLGGVYGQIPANKRCPQADSTKVFTNELCAELLPHDGRVWFRTVGNKPCFCECQDMMNLTLAKRQKLIEQRDSVNRGRVNDFIKKLGSDTLRAGTGQLSAPPTEVVYQTTAAGDHCVRDELIRSIVEEDLDATTYFAPFTEAFTFEYDSDSFSCSERFPFITSSRTYPLMAIPSTMVRHPAVKKEFIVFMLLHEMGHAMSSSPSSFEREWHADAWAISYGMRAYYGSGAAYVGAVTNLTEQFKAYYRSIYDADKWDHSHTGYDGVDTDHDHDYPKLQCRTGLLEFLSDAPVLAPHTPEGPANLLWSRSDSFIAGKKCWADAIAYGNLVYRGATYCDDDPCPRYLPPKHYTDDLIPLHDWFTLYAKSQNRIRAEWEDLAPKIDERYRELPEFRTNIPVFRTPPQPPPPFQPNRARSGAKLAQQYKIALDDISKSMESIQKRTQYLQWLVQNDKYLPATIEARPTGTSP